jgi:hypothetical protein
MMVDASPAMPAMAVKKMKRRAEQQNQIWEKSERMSPVLSQREERDDDG